MGGSEAKATESTESKMRLGHSKWNPVRRHRTPMQAQLAFSSKIAVLTVSWNCGNLALNRTRSSFTWPQRQCR